jgi:hypothetical protein
MAIVLVDVVQKLALLCLIPDLELCPALLVDILYFYSVLPGKCWFILSDTLRLAVTAPFYIFTNHHSQTCHHFTHSTLRVERRLISRVAGAETLEHNLSIFTDVHVFKKCATVIL